MAANSASPSSGAQTHVEYHPSPDQEASWANVIPGEFFIAPASGQAVATLYSLSAVITLGSADEVMDHSDGRPAPSGIDPDGALLWLGPEGLEPAHRPTAG